MARGVVSRKPRPKSAYYFVGLLYCFIVLLCVGVVSHSYVIYFPTTVARYSLFVLKVPLNTKQTNWQTLTRWRWSKGYQHAAMLRKASFMPLFCHVSTCIACRAVYGISDCLSNAGIVYKWILSNFFWASGTGIIPVFWTQPPLQHFKGNPLGWVLNYWGWENLANVTLYLRNGMT